MPKASIIVLQKLENYKTMEVSIKFCYLLMLLKYKNRSND